jgi:hypothetical protein
MMTAVMWKVRDEEGKEDVGIGTNKKRNKDAGSFWSSKGPPL